MTRPERPLVAATVPLREAAIALGGNPRHAYELVRDGRFPVRTIRVGSRIVVAKADLYALLGVPTTRRLGAEADLPQLGADEHGARE